MGEIERGEGGREGEGNWMGKPRREGGEKIDEHCIKACV